MSNHQIKIDVSASGIRAYITVHLNPDHDSEDQEQIPTPEEIIQELEAAGIKEGIDEEAIKSLVEEKRWGEQVLVAAGKPPENGAKGSAKHFFNVDPHPCPKDIGEGKVDYREIGLINTVEKDELLARRFFPTDGVPGVTVFGEPIEARDGEEVFILAGPNTYFADDQEMELRALATGSVHMRRGAICVDNTFIVKGDVDFSTGNIDFPDDVIINGDIMAGFTVKSGGNIEVRGVVEDAQVEAKGDVLVKGGFNGCGRGKIMSKGCVFLKFVENQTVEAEGCVHVGEACVHATITAGDRILLTTGSGTIIGGHLRARKGIQVKVLGNPQYTDTTVEVTGDDEELAPELKAKKDAIAEHREKIAEIETTVSSLKHQEMDNAGSDPELSEKIRDYQDQLYTLNEELEALTEDIRSLNIDGGCPGTIQAANKVYPGTNVIISGIHYEVKGKHNRAIFINIGGEVVDFPVESAAFV